MQSFRGISDMTLEFHETEPTVFIGVNGVGKSSILDCLAILLSWFVAQVQFDPKAVGSFIRRDYGRLVSGRQQELANGRIFGLEDIKNGEKKTSNEITILLSSQQVKWSINSILKGGTGLNEEKTLTELEPVTNKIRVQWEENPKTNIHLIVYYPINRAVFNIPLKAQAEKYLFNQVDAYEQSLDGIQVGFDSFFQWFRIVEDLENEEIRDNRDYRDKRLEAVRKAIYSLLGKQFSKLRVRRSPLQMTINKQDKELIVNQLSDGEKGLLAMVGDLARRLAIANPGLPDPLQGSGVVLIDEIELHLHPKWQREIIPALTRTFPNCQFIVTTHSPQVISDVQPDSIYILEAAPEGIVAKRPDSSFGRDSNYILEVLMDTPARKETIKDELLELFRLIDQGDLNGAKQLRQQIADQIGADEPELVKADVLLRRKEILNR
jgi:predicted ATP-binding protein involved in virulence